MFACLSGYMLFMLFWPFDTIEYQTPLRVLTPTVKIGECVVYEVNYTRVTRAPTQVTSTLVNDIIYVLSETQISAPKGEHKSVNRLLIPNAVAPGRYHMELELAWDVNHLRTIRKRIVSEPFTVIP